MISSYEKQKGPIYRENQFAMHMTSFEAHDTAFKFPRKLMGPNVLAVSLILLLFSYPKEFTDWQRHMEML